MTPILFIQLPIIYYFSLLYLLNISRSALVFIGFFNVNPFWLLSRSIINQRRRSWIFVITAIIGENHSTPFLYVGVPVWR